MLLDKITDALSAQTLVPIVTNDLQAYVQWHDNDKFLVDTQGKVKKKTSVNDVLNFIVPNPTGNNTNEVANLKEPNMISIVNSDTITHTVVIVMRDTTGIDIDVELFRALLLINEKLEWTPEHKWQVYTATGLKKKTNLGNVQEVEIDFGPTFFQTSGIFNVIDADIVPLSKILLTKAIKSPSDGRHIDEIFAETLELAAKANNGNFDLYIKSLVGSITGRFIINYSF